MRYKALGFTVWQGARWYLRRRVRGGAGKLAVAALSAAVAAGILAGKRQARS
jgi:hypothetical protein